MKAKAIAGEKAVDMLGFELANKLEEYTMHEIEMRDIKRELSSRVIHMYKQSKGIEETLRYTFGCNADMVDAVMKVLSEKIQGEYSYTYNRRYR